MSVFISGGDQLKKSALEISNEIGLHGGSSSEQDYITYLKDENKQLQSRIQELESEIIVLKSVNN
jgi:hypothetical protein